MRAKLNPEWQNAPYEMQFQTGSGKVIKDPYPNRFLVPPPGDLKGSEMMDWIVKNRVPTWIVE